MSASSKLSLKLVIDQTDNRVVFAEAGKETIDFLFSLLTLPVGTIVKLLSKQAGMVGSFANLYQSIENKDILLKPNAADTSTTQEIPLFFQLIPNRTVPKKSKFYLCSRQISSSTPFHHFVTENPETGCPICSFLMNREVQLVGDHTKEETAVEGANGGIVKGVDTYMVMDDLVVKPMSTVLSTIALLKKLKVKDVEALEEKVVHFNIDTGLKLLKMAFQSKEVLTSVFLRQEDPTASTKIKVEVE